MLILYNIGNTYGLNNQPNDAKNAYKLCKWVQKYEQNAFGECKTQIIFKYFNEALRFEDTRQNEKNDINITDKRRTNKNSKEKLDMQIIVNKIDYLWKESGIRSGNEKYYLENPNLNEENKQRVKNWRPILNEIHGILKPKEIIVFLLIFSKTQKKLENKKIMERSQSANRRRKILRKKKETFADLLVKNRIGVIDGGLGPDQYFENEICNELNINQDWLHEKNLAKRFNFSAIHNIHLSEKKSFKAKDIMHQFLITKRRDNIKLQTNDPELFSDYKQISRTAKKDMLFNTLKIKNNIIPKNDKPKSQKFTRTFNSAFENPYNLKSTKTQIKQNSSLFLNTTFSEQNTQFENTSEFLQKNINNLENYIKSKPKRYFSTIKQRNNLILKSPKISDLLSNSILHRAHQQSQLLSTAKGKHIKNNFSYF